MGRGNEANPKTKEKLRNMEAGNGTCPPSAG
jgi:hypothetical protein